MWACRLVLHSRTVLIVGHCPSKALHFNPRLFLAAKQQCHAGRMLLYIFQNLIRRTHCSNSQSVLLVSNPSQQHASHAEIMALVKQL